MKTKLLSLLVLFVSLVACQSRKEVDLIVHHGKIYTVDSAFSQQEAMAVHEGKIVAVGSNGAIGGAYTAPSSIDLEGKPVYPGFHDAHCHFYGLAQQLYACDLTGARSFEEVIARLQRFRKSHPGQPWLLGRGWDQNDWDDKRFPTRDALDAIFVDVPVKLERIDSHASICNEKALELAGITAGTEVEGGKVIVENGKATGVLVDNAAALVEQIVPEPSDQLLEEMLLAAQKECISKGLTVLTDAGLPLRIIQKIQEMQASGVLKLNFYAMAQPKDKEFFLANGFIEEDRLKVRSFKVYADGALGSRGACLLHPYHDKPGTAGFLLQSEAALRSFIKEVASANFQVNTHCIGDSANRVILDIYSKLLTDKPDHRFRIEHAQVINPSDMKRFGEFNVIPSVQPTHATSDMYWADERLGEERLAHAYAYKALLDQNGWLPLGSDFPVEAVNPLYGFHAAVARQDADNYPEYGFQIENAISREAALRGMTLWAAKAAFWEDEMGSLEVGKKADFVILDRDIMGLDKERLRKVEVQATFIGGEEVYSVGR